MTPAPSLLLQGLHWHRQALPQRSQHRGYPAGPASCMQEQPALRPAPPNSGGCNHQPHPEIQADCAACTSVTQPAWLQAPVAWRNSSWT